MVCACASAGSQFFPRPIEKRKKGDGKLNAREIRIDEDVVAREEGGGAVAIRGVYTPRAPGASTRRHEWRELPGEIDVSARARALSSRGHALPANERSIALPPEGTPSFRPSSPLTLPKQYVQSR